MGLQKSGIPVPLHIIVDRDNLPDGQADPTGFVETEDYVELNGKLSPSVRVADSHFQPD